MKVSRLAPWVLAFMVVATPAVALATPRDDVATAYIDAAQALNDINLDEAISILDAAIARAQAAGLADDPVLAPIYAMRGGLLFSNERRDEVMPALREAVRLDYYVTLPIELRSDDLQSLLDEARAEVARPTEAVIHTPPVADPNADIEFSALAGMALPDTASIVLYWRPVGSTAEFYSLYMNKYFGNYGSVVVPAAKHRGKDIEYFIYLFDENNKSLGSKGDKQGPLVLKMNEAAAAGGDVTNAGDGEQGEGEGEGEGAEEEEDEKKKKKKDRGGKSSLPRFFINLGVGTGVGVATGTAEQTYEQYQPGTATAQYTVREQACAVERWFEAGSELAQDAASFQANLATIQSAGSNILPAPPEDLVAAYDPAYCSRRHPVTTGLALAPFHVAPEFGFRVGKKLVLSVYARLQVVTGSQVLRDDPNLQLSQSFNLEVRSPQPPGTVSKPDFTFAIGAKAKYFVGKKERKFRVFVGGFAGYGFARLRVPMNFSNDRNGNSVPDATETALHGQQDANGQILPETCVPVWPYNAGCQQDQTGEMDRQLAMTVRGSTPQTDNRIDTVVIGPGFLGGIIGFNYQIVKNFALFGELDVGAWFPAATSGLFDLTVGPAITF